MKTQTTIIECVTIISNRSPSLGCIYLSHCNINSENQEEALITIEKTPISSFETNTRSLTVYPNPTTDFIFIRNDDNYDEAIIINALGLVKQKIKIGNSTLYKVDIDDYIEGSYFLRLFKFLHFQAGVSVLSKI